MQKAHLHTITNLRALKPLLLLLILCSWSSQLWAWRGAKVEVEAIANGKVYAGNSNSAGEYKSSDEATQTDGWSTSDKTFTFYIFAQANTGYKFSYWSTSNTATNGNSSNPKTVSITATRWGGGSVAGFPKTEKYYAFFAPIDYSIRFNGNGSTSGSMSNLSMTYATSKNLTANAFKREYTVTYDANGGSCATTSAKATYTFTNWTTQANGTGTTYADKAGVNNLTTTDGAVVDLYAQWNSASVTLPSATKAGCVLDGWYDGDTKEGEAGASYTPKSNVTLKAKWIDKYTPVMTGGDQSIMVDAQQLSAFTFEHVDGQQVHITVKSISAVNNGDGKVIEYDAANNKIIAHNAGVAEIYFTQAETSTIKEGTSATYTYTVYKYNSVFSNVADFDEVLVDASTSASNYALNYVKPQNGYIGNVISSPAGTPTLGEASGNFYYTLSQNVTTDNTIGSPDGSIVITYNASSKEATAKNQGVGTVYLHQKETYKYTGAETSFDVKVSKRSNALTCSWGNNWTKTLNFDEGSYVNISSTYSGEPALMSVTPIVVAQTEGDSIATFWPDSTTTDDPNGDAVYASCYIGNATWSVNQAENYKYLAAETKTLTVNVDKSSTTCYIFQDDAERNWSTISSTTYGDGSFYLNTDGKKLQFQVKRTAIWGFSNNDYFFVKYSADGYNWSVLKKLNTLSDEDKWYDFDLDISALPIKYIKFESETGATGNRHVRNVRVTRKKVFKLENEDGQEITELSMPTNTLGGNHTTAKFVIDYNTCADEINVASNHSNITVSDIKFDSNNSGKKTIEVTYSCDTLENITGVITVYTPYDNKTLIVRAETEKKTQEIRWRAGYQGASLTLPVDLSTDTAAYVSSGLTTPPVVYSTNNPEVIRIYDDRTGFEIIDAGTAQLTASHEGDEEYKSATDTKTITATYKKIQIIVWGQDLTRLHTGDSPINLTAKVMEVDAEGNMSESDRTAYIQYNVLDENVVSVTGTILTIGNAGQTTITAYVPGNDTIEEASTVTPVRVSPASANDCDYGNLEYTATFDKHENKDEGYIEGDDYILFYDNIFHGATSFPELSVTFTITDPIGVPGQMSFKHKGTRYGVGKLSTFEGNIEVRISDDGSNWSGVIWSEKPTVGEYKIATIPLQRTTRYVKFTRPQGGTGYHHIGSVVISPAQYMEADDVNFGNRQAGEVFAKSDVTVNYSNLKGDYIYVTSDTSVVTVTPAVIPVECGSVDNRQFTITCAPTARGTIDSRVILRESISGLTDTIHVTANVEQGSQTITWNPERTTFQVVESAELTAVLPTRTNKGQTVTLESSDPTVVDIIAGQAVIYKPGNVTITASQAGNANFAPAENVEKDFVITLANLSLTAPSASSINDEQPLSASVLTGGNATDVHGPVDGTWSWESPETVYAVGTYYPRVIFTPNEHPEWYTGNTTTTTIVITPSSYRYEGNGQWSEAGHWNKGKVPTINDDVVINGNVTIPGEANAKSLTINEGSNVTLSVSGQLTIGSGNSKVLDNYGNLHVENGGKVILNEGDLKVKDLVIEAKLGNMNTPANSAEINQADLLNVTGDVYFKLTFDPRGHISAGWYDFVVPFEVDVVGGIFLPDNTSKPLTNKVDFAIMEFSEERRAANEKSWSWVSGTLQPGKLYTITLDDEKPERNTYMFKKRRDAAIEASSEFSAQCTSNAASTDKGWNGMGNGTLQYRQLDLPVGAKIQVYDHENRCYVQCDAKDYKYAVGTAFFVQVETTESINLTTISNNRLFRAPRAEEASTDEFCLALTLEGAENASDHIWVSASDEATGEYVIGRDLVKMGEPNEAKVARIWAKRNNLQLCDAEMPLVYGEANCDLNVFAPADGTYLLEIENGPADAELYLTFNGKVIWDLSSSPASLVLKKGLKEGFGLRMKYNDAPGMAEGVDDINDDTQSMRKVLIDNKIYIITPEGAMYDVNGKLIR